jgi:hypothetical protein
MRFSIYVRKGKETFDAVDCVPDEGGAVEMGDISGWPKEPDRIFIGALYNR